MMVVLKSSTNQFKVHIPKTLRKILLLYSLDMIKAEKILFFKKCEEAKKDLSRVSMFKLNIREKDISIFLSITSVLC